MIRLTDEQWERIRDHFPEENIADGHGFCVTSETALFAYKCTDLYHPECEVGVAYDDPEIGIRWPIAAPLVGANDRENLPLAKIDPSHLPRYESNR